jgi:hypothetical protein
MLNKTTIFMVAVTSLLAITSCSAINKKLGLSDDNIAEELVEAMVEAKTGVDFDLTPSSPEQEKK